MTALTRPPLWRDLLWGIFALLVLILAWTFVVARVIEPAGLMNGEPTVSKAFAWLVAGPILIVGLVIGWRQLVPHGISAETAVSASDTQPGSHDYTLEIVSLGVTLDQYRQGALWDALRKGSPWATIRNQDPQKVDWSEDDKGGTTGGRVGHTLENGLAPLPSYWGTPVLNAEQPSYNSDSMEDMRKYPDVGMGMADDLSSDGLLDYTMPIGCDRVLAERPDRLLDKVFAFFDANPDVPYIVVTSTDDPYSRDGRAAPGTPKLQRDGYYIPAIPDSSALFVLARRERVDALRPYAFHDVVDGHQDVSMDELERKGLGRKLYLMWMALRGAMPFKHRDQPPRFTPDQIPLIDVVKEHPDTLGPYPQEVAWKRAATIFATRSDLHLTGVSALLPVHAPSVPTNWKPTPWFPIPWSKEQIEDFDKLPTLGYLHRPIWVKLTDEHGKHLEHAEQRQTALAKGWADAVGMLPEARRTSGPARVIVATADNTDRQVDLHRVLDSYHTAHPAVPLYDPNKPEVFINTDRRLGNTGAATLFMQMAIGTMASYTDGGPSVAINYRDGNEASIVLITPPSDEIRKKQGNAPLRDRATPAIDPKNYAQP